jgi:hypothetical protein
MPNISQSHLERVLEQKQSAGLECGGMITITTMPLSPKLRRWP